MAQRKESTSLLLYIAAAAAAVFGAAAVASWGPTLIEQWFRPPVVESGGVPVEPPRQMPDFTLVDQNGQPRSLASLQGKPALVFFGYTHCPDVCPVTMSALRRLKRDLGPQGDAVRFVMISVDGERDTPDVMKAYVEAFDPAFIGLTGDFERVGRIAADYGAFATKQKVEGTQAAYLVGHTSYTYLLDARGRWTMTYPFDTPTDAIRGDVVRLLGG